jgi:hypothetical protein
MNTFLPRSVGCAWNCACARLAWSSKAATAAGSQDAGGHHRIPAPRQAGRAGP